MTRWSGAVEGEGYAARFDALAESGADVHGEARLCESLLPAGGRVLDAGCGTGRVAIRLAARGFDCVGVDVDRSMLDVARRRGPGLRWVEADLTELALDESFDLVVAAGNVLPLVAEGTGPTCRRRRGGSPWRTTTTGAPPRASCSCSATRPGTARRTRAAATPSASTDGATPSGARPASRAPPAPNPSHPPCPGRAPRRT